MQEGSFYLGPLLQSKQKSRLCLLSVSKRLVFVRVEGLEPPRLAALDPKSSASTNSATPASAVLYAFSKSVAKIIGF